MEHALNAMENRKMWIWVLFSVYILMSVTGLVLIKSGANGAGFAIQSGLLNFQISLKLLFGAFIYMCSFLLSVYIMGKIKLSLFYPLSAGAVLVLTCVVGHLFFKEHIGMPQIVGIALILAGVIAINI